MSETISIDMPEAVMERFRRAAESAKRPVQELLVNALTTFAPKPPPGLPEDLHRELEEMETFTDEDLKNAFDETLDPEDLPEQYSPGDASDRLMLRKAYAGVLLQWRGYDLPQLASSKS